MEDHDEYPDWEPGDPVPEGFYVCDGNAESGPCEPYLVPIEFLTCENGHGNQRVVKHLTYNPADPTAASQLACGCVVF